MEINILAATGSVVDFVDGRHGVTTLESGYCSALAPFGAKRRADGGEQPSHLQSTTLPAGLPV